MTIKISICMITYNKAPFLSRSVPAILESFDNWDEVEFLLLDNGCTDDTKNVIATLSEKYPINVFKTRGNVGLNGYSMLVEQSSGDIIVTVDDDIFYLSRGWQECFTKALNSNFAGRKFGYVGADTINKDGGRVYDVSGYASIGDMTIEIGTVGGWFAATKRSVLEEIGGFHDGMPELYLEDADFQRRAWRYGYLCGTIVDVKVYHARAPRHYIELACEDTYMEKVRLASEVGIELEPLVDKF